MRRRWERRFTVLACFWCKSPHIWHFNKRTYFLLTCYTIGGILFLSSPHPYCGTTLKLIGTAEWRIYTVEEESFGPTISVWEQEKDLIGCCGESNLLTDAIFFITWGESFMRLLFQEAIHGVIYRQYIGIHLSTSYFIHCVHYFLNFDSSLALLFSL